MLADSGYMKIGLASSGLGHVARGIEAWARDSGEALSRLLVNGDRLMGGDWEVVLFSGANVLELTDAGRATANNLATQQLHCLKRGGKAARLLASVSPGFTWRWGWKSAYGWEQYTFAKSLIKELRRRPVDIVHTQDVIVAQMLESARKKGRVTAKTILAHGTEESMECLAQFEYLQELSPPYAARHKRKVFMIPNFVDTSIFSPVEDAVNGYGLPVNGENDNQQRATSIQQLRQRIGVPPDAFVIGCVAAVKKGHKRIDYLIREYAAAIRGNQRHETIDHRPEDSGQGMVGGRPGRDRTELKASTGNAATQQPDNLATQQPYLLIAGAKTAESDELVALADELAPGRVKFLFDLPREEMPDVYRCMDLYVHPAPEEIFGICLLEAMACGVPVVAHNSGVLKWVVGDLSQSHEDTKMPGVHHRDTEAQRRGGADLSPGAKAQAALHAGERGEEHPSTSNREPTTLLLEGAGGWNVDVTAEGFLGRTVKSLTTDEHGWTRMKSNARRHVEEKFSIAAVVPQFIRMYGAVLAGSGA